MQTPAYLSEVQKLQTYKHIKYMQLPLRPPVIVEGGGGGAARTFSNWRPVAMLIKYGEAECYKYFDKQFFCVVRTINMATQMF
jgi:hypothetical protein